jgi:hypothetical protein
MPETEDRFARITMALEAAAVLEAGLHMQADFLVEQAHADKHGAITVQEVRKVIVEAIRDIKMTVCEFDGEVSRGDRGVIKKASVDLMTKARSRFLTARMTTKMNTLSEYSLALDEVEQAVANDAVSKAQTDESRMRARQAAIWAIADLRIQQMTA